MEKFPDGEYKSEKMDLKTEALQKYFYLAQMREHPELIERWGKENTDAYDKLSVADPEFLEQFNENEDATMKEFEEKLEQYR